MFYTLDKQSKLKPPHNLHHYVYGLPLFSWPTDLFLVVNKYTDKIRNI